MFQIATDNKKTVLLCVHTIFKKYVKQYFLLQDQTVSEMSVLF